MRLSSIILLASDVYSQPADEVKHEEESEQREVAYLVPDIQALLGEEISLGVLVLLIWDIRVDLVV